MTIVNQETWISIATDIAQGSSTFIAIWGERCDDGAAVHLAIRRQQTAVVEVLTLPTPDLHFPSIGKYCPAAILMERAIFDLQGLVADGLPDPRPWLDHGVWPQSRTTGPYIFKPVTGDGVHQIPVGPVHAGTIEPGHFRISVNGETIVRLEARLGYTHKGTLKLMRGARIDHAAKLAGRISGDSTVAYSFAFARAIEQALGLDVPPRANALRGVMAELERLANHFSDFGAICNDGGFPLLNAHGAMLREQILRLSLLGFGHRLMMDRIIPGGVCVDITSEAARRIVRETLVLRDRFERLVEVYDKTASLQDRVVAAGRLYPVIAQRLGCGGYVGRASAQNFDARRDMPYAPYAAMSFKVPFNDVGDADARIRIRIEEARESIALIGLLLRDLPDGPIGLPPPESFPSCAGSSIVEGFRGDIFAYVRASEGRVEDVYLRDPSWFFWPALEVAVEGNIVADFPLCNKSFNSSYSGCDL
jgi:Ni,Fe-hydrogenase III large subunit